MSETPTPDGQPVGPKDASKRPPTLMLVVLIVLIALVIGLTVGLIVPGLFHSTPQTTPSPTPSVVSTTEGTVAPPAPLTPWSKNLADDGIDVVTDMAVTSDDQIIVVGGAAVSGRQGAILARYAADGTLMWKTSDAMELQQLWSVAVSSDGAIIVAGNGGGGALLARFTPDGQRVWQHIYTGSNGAYFYAVAITAEGDIVAAGWASGGGDFGDMGDSWGLAAVAKVSMDGNLLWARTYGDSDKWDTLSSIAATSDGGTVVGGSCATGNGICDEPWTAFVTKLDAAGDVAWTYSYGKGYYLPSFDDLGIDSSGNIIAIGSAPESDSNAGYASLAAKIAPDGKQVWANRYGITEQQRLRRFREVAVTPDGSAIIGGDTFTTEGQDQTATIFKIDPHGAEVWATTYSTEGLVFAAVSVLSTGNVVIAGFTPGLGDDPTDNVLSMLDPNGSMGH